MSKNRWNGPWALKMGGDYAYIRDCNGMIVHEAEDFYPSAIPDEYLPLVAAAPDLYEALAECVEFLLVERRVFVHSHAIPRCRGPEVFFDESTVTGRDAAELAEMDQRIAKARTALAAAEGRS